MRVSTYFSDYKNERFWFSSSNDRVTIWRAMQSRDVLNYMEFPDETTPPAMLTRILIDGNPDLYDVADSLLEHDMNPETDEERAMLERYESRREGLVERGRFFWTMLNLDFKGSHSVPYIFYPMLKSTSTPNQVVDQLLGLIGDLPSYSQILFFALVFKFGGPNHKTVPSKKTPLLQWKLRKRTKKDPLYAVYIQAAKALWDYVDHLKHGEGTFSDCRKRQSLDWIAWMRERQSYQTFLETCIDGSKERKFRRRVSIFKIFIWRYGVKNEKSFY